MDGIILLNKEKNMTSRDVVNMVCKRLNTSKVGHTGTLDPIATGLLVLCVGEGLKLIELLTNHDKDYLAKARLGIKTDTYDITGRVIEEKTVHITQEEIEKALTSFEGEYEQTVPIYSSIKVNGKKLYEYARSGEEVVLPKHLVQIRNMKLLTFEDNTFTFSVTVSSGTYIRSLINDIGNKLHIPMTMEELQRVRVGDFYLKEASSLDHIQVLPIESLKIKKVEVDTSFLKKISNGVPIKNIYHEDLVMFTQNGKPISLYKDAGNKIMKSYRVFHL